MNLRATTAELVVGQIEALKIWKMEETAGIVNSTRDIFAADVKTQNTAISAASNAHPRTTICTRIPGNELGGKRGIEYQAVLEMEQ